MSNGPNKVVRTQRSVIERKLLESLEDGDHVAIIASKQDLKDLIGALRESGVCAADDAWERRKALAVSLSQLLQEAFP